MNILGILLFITTTICILSSYDAATIFKNEQQLIIRGRVLYGSGSRIEIEPNAKLTIQLQDTSLTDAPGKLIAKGIGTAARFPMAFAIRYLPSQLTNGTSYSLTVTITNKNNELLYINDRRIPIIPIGVNRTKFIDVPVISVTPTSPEPEKARWPELVGTTGEDAVKIIKQETGFTNVVIVKEGQPVTMDYRTDRVRVYVNNNGVVSSTPTVG